jgi:hypothetical protein
MRQRRPTIPVELPGRGPTEISNSLCSGDPPAQTGADRLLAAWPARIRCGEVPCARALAATVAMTASDRARSAGDAGSMSSVVDVEFGDVVVPRVSNPGRS